MTSIQQHMRRFILLFLLPIFRAQQLSVFFCFLTIGRQKIPGEIWQFQVRPTFLVVEGLQPFGDLFQLHLTLLHHRVNQSQQKI